MRLERVGSFTLACIGVAVLVLLVRYLTREVAMRLLISAIAFLAIGFAMQMTSDAYAKSGKAASPAKRPSHGWTQCNPQRCYHTKTGQPRRPYYYPRYHRVVDPYDQIKR